jgi:hypothetical protein
VQLSEQGRTHLDPLDLAAPGVVNDEVRVAVADGLARDAPRGDGPLRGPGILACVLRHARMIVGGAACSHRQGDAA